jgi:dimeric dUTPase (all-alpha-NTP-PPase superfamily)
MLSTALLHEAVELQRETNWKWWKKETKTDIDKVQEEIIDIWHFVIQVTIEAGLDSKKLIEKYMEKNRENLARQERGY